MKFRIQVKPNSKHKTELEQQPDGTYIVYTKEPAVEGRANAEAVAIVARHFGLPRFSVQLKTGATARYKTIEIATK